MLSSELSAPTPTPTATLDRAAVVEARRQHNRAH